MFDKVLQSQFVSNMVSGWIRHAAGAAVPVLIAAGFLQNNQINDFMGSVIFLGALVWSGVEKKLAQKNAAATKAA